MKGPDTLTPPGPALLTLADLATVLSALADAAEYRTHMPCPRPEYWCAQNLPPSDVRQALTYRALAGRLGDDHA